MNYLFLSKEQAAAISVNLAPFFVGREGEVLLYHADIIGKAVFDTVSIDISNLYDFKADLESLIGAGMIGVADAAGNFTSTNVEGVLSELFYRKLNTSAASVYGLSLLGSSNASAAQTLLGLGSAAMQPSSAFQPADSDLSALAGLTLSADTAPYWTGSGAADVYTITSFGRTLVAAATAAAARAALGAGTGTVTSVAATGSTGLTVGGSPVTTSGTITFTLSANLQSWSGVTPATKADDSAVVHLAGTETVTGSKTFSLTINCGSFFNSTGALAGYQMFDRTLTTRSWVAYANNGVFNIYSGNAALDFLKINDTTGVISDRYGALRSVPLTTQNAAYTFVVADAGRGRVKNDTSAYTYTVNNSVFSAGDVLTVANDSGTGSITIAAGAGVTLYLAGTATTGSRTVAPRGVATIFMATASVGYVSGPGVT